jgi:hypothetical protein
LVLVIIDGLRVDTSLNKEVMPVLNTLRQHGAYATMHSHAPSFSEPGYSTILTGAWPEINDGPSFNVDYDVIQTLTQDTIFGAAHRNNMKTAVSGYYWFEKLIPAQYVDASYYDPMDDRTADEHVMAKALPLLQDNSYQLLLIHIDQVDYAGHHEGGPISPKWNEAASRADAYLGQIVNLLDLNQDTILVISDHGHILMGGHGGHDADVLKEPFVLSGAGIKPGDYGDVNMVDVAPTIAALLGTNLPASAQGSVQLQMLNLPSDTLNALPAAEQNQQAQLYSAYITAIGSKYGTTNQIGSSVAEVQKAIADARAARLTAERIPRAAIVIVLLGLVIFLSIKYPPYKIGWMAAGIGVYALVFVLRFLVNGTVFSFSSVQGSTWLILYILTATALAYLASWLAYSFGSRNFKLPPTVSATHVLEYTLGLQIFIAVIPAVFFVLNGTILTWTHPNMGLTYLALICMLQIVFAAVGLVFAGCTALISKIIHKPA